MINDNTTFPRDDQGSVINFLNNPRVAEWLANDDDAAAEEAANEYGTFKDASDDDPVGRLETRGLMSAFNFKPHVEDDYLVDEVLSVGALSVLYGPSNSGKSFLALDMAYRIAAGIWWNGHKVKQAAVLYYATEGGNGLRNRIVALRDHHSEADPRQQKAVPFYCRCGGVDFLTTADDANEVIADVAAVRKVSGLDIVLVVVDTLSRTMPGGDENGSQHMTSVIDRVDHIRRETKAHVMLVHHTGKDASRGARGHSSLRAAVDTEIEVSADDNGRAATITKQRDYATGREYPFTLEVRDVGRRSDGKMVTTCVAVAEEVKPMWTNADKVSILKRIDEGHDSGERFTRYKKGAKRWAGDMVMEITGVDAAKAQDIIETLIRNGDVAEQDYKNKDSKERKGLFITQ